MAVPEKLAAAAIAALALTVLVAPVSAAGVNQAQPTPTTTTVDPSSFDRPAEPEPAPEPDPTPAPEPAEPEPTEPEPTDPDETPPAQPDVPTELGFAVTVDPGMRGLTRAGRPVAVTIEITAQRLIAGELRLVATTDARTVTSGLPIEVPGSSTKRFVLVSPVLPHDGDALAVQLEVDGEVVLDHPIEVTTDPTTELVGVMGLVSAAASLPDSAELAIGRGTARLAGIDAEVLGAGLGALATYDVVVATAADLDALSGREYDALAAWITDGGHLLVDEVAGPVPRLPGDWQPTADRASAAGRGLVRLTGGGAKAGEWDTILMPTPVDAASEAAGFDRRTTTDPGSIDRVLSEDAGFSLPSITAIMVFLGLYIVVVGPVSHVLLRRRGRTGRWWATVPALAVVATAGVVLLGSDLRDNTSASHFTVVVTGAGTDVAHTRVLVDGDETGIRLPRGWTSRIGDDTGDAALPDVDIDAGDGESRARVDLEPDQYAILGARGPIETAGLEVTALTTRSGQVEGTVVNRSGVTLHDVSVLVSAYGRSFGSLAPGEEREFSLVGLDGFELRDDATGILWENGRLADIGAWQAVFEDRGGLNANPVGAVTAVGWTDALDAPVRTADDHRIRSGRTVLVTNQPVTSSDPSNMATRLELVRGPADGEDGGGNLFGLRATYQGVIAWEGDPERLAITVPRFASDIAVWNGDRWRAMTTSGREETRVLPVEDVVVDGIVHIRIEIDRRQIFEFANGRTVTIEPVPDEGADDA